MQLSEHFTLEEMVHSDQALRWGLDNTPCAEQIANLARLCTLALEPARAILGCPMHINSGFRSPAVNRLVGSTAGHSAHLDGLAADIVPIGVPLRNAFDALRTNLKNSDQIILECSAWIHIAVAPPGEQPRGQALLALGGPGNWSYQKA